MFVEVPGANADQIPTHYPINTLEQQAAAVFAMMERSCAALPISTWDLAGNSVLTGETFRAGPETLENIGLDLSVLEPALAKMTEPELNAIGNASLGSAMFAVYRRELSRRLDQAAAPSS